MFYPNKKRTMNVETLIARDFNLQHVIMEQLLGEIILTIANDAEKPESKQLLHDTMIVDSYLNSMGYIIRQIMLDNDLLKNQVLKLESEVGDLKESLIMQEF